MCYQAGMTLDIKNHPIIADSTRRDTPSSSQSRITPSLLIVLEGMLHQVLSQKIIWLETTVLPNDIAIHSN